MSIINPNRLKQARRANGYTQERLGLEIGKNKSIISKWESGETTPNHEIVVKIAETFDLPVKWFTLPDYHSDTGLYQYRSNSGATKHIREIASIRLQWLRELTHIFEEWVEFPKLNLPESINRLQALNLTDNDIEKYAQQLRQYWELGNRPINDLIGILETNGIIVAKEFINAEDMDGVSTWFDNRPYIWVADDKRNYFRSRFDIAHELGHIILHQNLTLEDCTKTKWRYKEMERQANLFASHFLLPRQAVTLSFRSVTLDNLLIEKKHWGVSVGALIMQYHNLGIISDDYKTRLFKNYSYRKWRKNEPFDSEVPTEQPQLMRNTIELLLNEGGFNKQDIIERSYYHQKQLEQLCALPKGFFNISKKVPQLKIL